MTLRISVLVSGVIDPKWPISALGLDAAAGGATAASAVTRKLSPFDEAVLECALKLRDAHESARLSVLVAGDGLDDSLLRSVAAFKPDRLRGLAMSRDLCWDAQAAARLIARAVSEDSPDLVLIGREFGEQDEGTLAPCLAEALGHPFVGLVQEARVEVGQSGAVERVFMRERSGMVETIRMADAVVASVTNAKSNRLRHPLMKNVMHAKREPMAIAACDAAAAVAMRRAIAVCASSPVARGTEPCRMLTGSVEQQAEQLAAFLRGSVSAAA